MHLMQAHHCSHSRSSSAAPLDADFSLICAARHCQQPMPSMLSLRIAGETDSLSGVQAAVLVYQHWYGPRSIVPKFLLPPKYDYFRPVRLDAKTLESGGSTRDAAAAAAQQTAGDSSQPDSPHDEEVLSAYRRSCCLSRLQRQAL